MKMLRVFFCVTWADGEHELPETAKHGTKSCVRSEKKKREREAMPAAKPRQLVEVQ